MVLTFRSSLEHLAWGKPHKTPKHKSCCYHMSVRLNTCSWRKDGHSKGFMTASQLRVVNNHDTQLRRYRKSLSTPCPFTKLWLPIPSPLPCSLLWEVTAYSLLFIRDRKKKERTGEAAACTVTGSFAASHMASARCQVCLKVKRKHRGLWTQL